MKKVEYSLHTAGPADRIFRKYLLLESVDSQKWYYILELKFWRGPGLICIQ